MSEHQPGFVQNDEAWRARQPFFDSAKQVGENRYEISLAHIHELLDLDALE
ncbi:hypothetical protein D3C72_2085190 [compost metagenome]